jgi:hypothetical protein
MDFFFKKTKPAMFKNFLTHHGKWDFWVFTLLTIFSLLNGQVTVFYLIYFFWWNELLRIIIDRLFYKTNPNAQLASNPAESIFSSFFLMGIYFVFIVVFFGFIAAVDNTALVMANMKVLFFGNWFFNANLVFLIVERIWIHKSHKPQLVSFGGFTPNMILLHVSIILGGVVMFFIVKNFPTIFTPENLWGSVLIATPFLLLQLGASYLTSRIPAT